MAPIPFDHPRQQRTRDGSKTGAVGLDHLIPVVEIGALRGLQPEGEPRVVDEHVDRREIRGQPLGQGLHGGSLAHVQLERQECRTEFLGECFKAVETAGGGDHAVAALDEGAGDGGSEAGRGTRY